MSLLTKSKYLIGLTCLKYFWMMYHDLDKIPEANPAAKLRMEQGKKIGQFAKQFFPEGIDITEDFTENLKLTQKLLSQRKILFEAGIIVGDLYARADILVPVENNQWDIVEVKSSTKPKEEHYHDLAFQRHVYEKAGLKIRKCCLMHINSNFRKNGEVKAQELMMITDITEVAEQAMEGINVRIDIMLKIKDNPKSPPDVRIGDGCSNGLSCLSKDCWSFLPEGNVFELSRGGEKSLELLEAEVLSLKDIPDEFPLTKNQQIQRKCAQTGQAHIEKEKLKMFLDALKGTLYYLDFETFQVGIPLYDGTKPYQQIPFQFSCHIVDKAKTKHKSFLASSSNDPRKEFLLSLKEALGDDGLIVTYNQSFEKTRLKEIAEALPEFKEWVEKTLPRFIDLWEPFRNFYYYHPKQAGSGSIKDVLPALTGKDYRNLDIADGEAATTAFLNMTFGDTPNEQKPKIRADLEKYCAMDTEAMILIVNELKKLE